MEWIAGSLPLVIVGWLKADFGTYRYRVDKSTKFGTDHLYILRNDSGVGAQKSKFIKWVKFKMASKMAAGTLLANSLINNSAICSCKTSFSGFSRSRNSKIMVLN